MGWTDIPADVQGEILSWCPVDVWCRILDTYRASRAEFPYSSIHHMSFKRMRWINPIAETFHLSSLKTIDGPQIQRSYQGLNAQFLERYHLKAFLDAYPRARFVQFEYLSPLFFLQCATEQAPEALLEWYSRFDVFHVRFLHEAPQSMYPFKMTWPRLVKGGFGLVLRNDTEFRIWIQQHVELWTSIVKSAAKLECHNQTSHPGFITLRPLIQHLLPVVDFRSAGANPDYYLPKLSGILDVDLLTCTQTRYALCNTPELLVYFLDHEEAFAAARISAFIPAECMSNLTCEVWIRAISSCHVFDVGIRALVGLFLYHFPETWCTNPHIIEWICDMLIEKMINMIVECPTEDIHPRYFDDLSKFGHVMPERLASLMASVHRRKEKTFGPGGGVCVRSRCEKILECLPYMQENINRFLSKLGVPSVYSISQ